MRTLFTLFLAALCQFGYAQKTCGTVEYLEKLRLQAGGSFADRFAGISHADQSTPSTAAGEELSSQTVINIPVVVHVLSNGTGISDEQILSQIDALNVNFNRENEDFRKVPAVFASVAGTANIRFHLAKVDPEGRATTGITRTRPGRLLWTNDDKLKSPEHGGVAPWDPSSYLNIWVADLVPGLLGYSSAPGSDPKLDGVVIKRDIFGTIGVSGKFNLGRTAVHEVGHWLNLKHLWGDYQCGSDEVDDTPQQKTYNQGSPSFPRVRPGCSEGNPYGEMFMNFMDFTNDASMMMFTQGQVARMRALFNPGGARQSMLRSKALGEAWNQTPVTVERDAPAEAPARPAITLKLYPNPAVDRITIAVNGDENIKGRHYGIYSVEGRLMATGVATANVFTLQVANLHRGLYFVSIGEGAEKQTVRFMKQ